MNCSNFGEFDLKRLYIIARRELYESLQRLGRDTTFAAGDRLLLICDEMKWPALAKYAALHAAKSQAELLRLAGHAAPCFGAKEISGFHFQQRLQKREALLAARLAESGITAIDLQVWAFHQEPETPILQPLRLLVAEEAPTAGLGDSFWEDLHSSFVETPLLSPCDRISVIKHCTIRPFLPLKVKLEGARGGWSPPGVDSALIEKTVDRARVIAEEASKLVSEMEPGSGQQQARVFLLEMGAQFDAPPAPDAADFQEWLGKLDALFNSLRESLAG